MTTSPSIVRPAVPDDESELWRLFRLHHEENAMFTLSERKVQFYLDRVLWPERIPADDVGPRGIIGTIGVVGSLEAAIMLVLGAPWYSEEISMDDCMVFVDPDHRRSNHGHTLIAYACNIVDKIREAHPSFKMIAGVLSTKRTAPKMRMYERQLTPIGAFYLYPAPADFVPLKNTYR